MGVLERTRRSGDMWSLTGSQSGVGIRRGVEGC